MSEPIDPPPSPPQDPTATPPPQVEPLNYGPPATTYMGPAPDQNAQTWGMLAHLSALSGYLIPFGHVIGPLIIWMVKGKEHPFIDDQGKESLNFQITVTIAAAVSAALICVFIGIVMLIAVGVAALVLIIIAAVKANQGEPYRYPLTIRLIK